MINIEKQKEHFKNHIATVKDYGNIKILDFKNPNSNEYRIRFLFEEDYYRLHITGDLGDLIACNPYNMTFDKFNTFANNVGYFREKIDCVSRRLYYYDDNKAREDLLKLVEELEIESWEFEDVGYSDSNEWIDNILENFYDDRGISDKGYEIFEKIVIDAFEYVSDIGKKETGILDLYMLAFKLAMEQLFENRKCDKNDV